MDQQANSERNKATGTRLEASDARCAKSISSDATGSGAIVRVKWQQTF
jgi:hypothetical protein